MVGLFVAASFGAEKKKGASSARFSEENRAVIVVTGLRLDETLIVTSCLSPAFGVKVAAAIGVAADRVLSATGIDRDPLSSSLTIAWDQASRRGRLNGREPILFAAVGGGLTSTCMVWRR